MILIISDAFDLHADVVAGKIAAENVPFLRLNLDTASLKSSFITFTGNSWRIETPTGAAESGAIACVWCRRSSVSLTLEEQRDQSSGFRLWRSEWNRVLFGFYNAIGTIPWMNGIRAATLADNKYYQFSVAKSCGLAIPDFITSNKKEILIEFAKAHGEVALKFMAQDMYELPDGTLGGLYVNRIDSQDLTSFGAVFENPITLQRYVNKSFEVRYTVVDSEHVACRIDSQSSETAAVDWRRYDIPNTPHSKLCPNPEIVSKVNLLMERLGLSFGALDFIVDAEGNWWFLEVNSTGQWLWIEDLIGVDISGSISRYLIRRSMER